MENNAMRVRLTLIDEILGTAAADPKIHETYIASKAPDAKNIEEEVAAIGAEAVTEEKKTIFSRDPEGNPVMWGYQIRGFFKSACSALRTISDTRSSKVKAYKKTIDLRIMVYPDIDDIGSRMIPINVAGDMGDCQRPLRASTAQGDRVALANSESIPKGSTLEFWVYMLDPKDKPLVEEWLDYGKFNGLGQWRNSGKGAFVWDELDDDDNVIGGNAERYRKRQAKKKTA
jgi:hypothetical protein